MSLEPPSKPPPRKHSITGVKEVPCRCVFPSLRPESFRPSAAKNEALRAALIIRSNCNIVTTATLTEVLQCLSESEPGQRAKTRFERLGLSTMLTAKAIDTFKPSPSRRTLSRDMTRLRWTFDLVFTSPRARASPCLRREKFGSRPENSTALRLVRCSNIEATLNTFSRHSVE